MLSFSFPRNECVDIIHSGGALVSTPSRLFLCTERFREQIENQISAIHLKSARILLFAANLI